MKLRLTRAVLAAAMLASFAAGSAFAAAETYDGSFGPTTLVDDRLCSFPVTVTIAGAFHGVVTPNGRDVSVAIRSTTFSAFGRSVEGTSPHQVVFTAEAMAVTGLTFRIVVPGEGALVIDAGRGAFDENGLVLVAGQHPIVEGSAPKLCDFLQNG